MRHGSYEAQHWLDNRWQTQLLPSRGCRECPVIRSVRSALDSLSLLFCCRVNCSLGDGVPVLCHGPPVHTFERVLYHTPFCCHLTRAKPKGKTLIRSRKTVYHYLMPNRLVHTVNPGPRQRHGKKNGPGNGYRTPRPETGRE